MNRHNGTLNELDLPLFRGIEAEELAKWNAITMICTLGTGEVLYQQGDIAQSFYIILSGGARLVEYTPAGKAVTVKVYGAGEIIGLLSLTEEHRHAATVEALDKTRIVAFRSAEARALIMQNGTLAMRLVDCLTQHVHHAHDRIRHLAAENTEKRLARALLHFHHKFGHVKEDVYAISAKLSQRDISEFTGTTLETVNRYLRRWEDFGWVRLSYKQIDILKLEELQEIAASINAYGYMPE